MKTYLERDRAEGAISIMRFGAGLCILVEVSLGVLIPSFGYHSVFGLCGKVLVMGGLAGWPLWQEGRGCPLPDIAFSSQLHNRPNTGQS